VFSATGTLIRATQETNNVMTCTGGHLCQAIYLGAEIHLFAGRQGDLTQLVSTSFFPGSTGLSGQLTVWDVVDPFLVKSVAYGSAFNNKVFFVGGQYSTTWEGVAVVRDDHTKMNFVAQIKSNFHL